MIKILLENKADINKKNNLGKVPLFYSRYNYNIVELLIENKANIRSIDIDDNSILDLLTLELKEVDERDNLDEESLEVIKSLKQMYTTLIKNTINTEQSLGYILNRSFRNIDIYKELLDLHFNHGNHPFIYYVKR